MTLTLASDAVMTEKETLGHVINLICSPQRETQGKRPLQFKLQAVARILDGLRSRGLAPNALSGTASDRIVETINQARSAAANQAMTEDARVASIQLLGREDASRKDDFGLMEQLLVPQSSAVLQRAVVAQLARRQEPSVAGVLIAGWRSHSPELRSQILDVLASRPTWAESLRQSLESATISASELSAPVRQRLLDRSNNSPGWQKLLATKASTDRGEVLREFQPALTFDGDANRGIGGKSVLCDELYQRVARYRTEVTKGVAGDLDKSLVFAHLFESLGKNSPSVEHIIDTGTAAGLRELFRATTDRLPIVSAHRGGAGPRLPENCIATFEETLRNGFAMIEIDPRVTSDGHVVVHHDATLDRTTTGHGPIKKQTLAQLKELRLKDSDGKATEHQIPTLTEVFRWAKGKTVLVIDKKDLSVAQRVQQIEEHGAQAHAMVIAGGVNAAKECYALNPDIMMEVFIPDRQRFDALAASGVPWSNVIAFVGHEPTKDRELLRLLHEKGVTTMAGTSRNLDWDLAKKQEPDEQLGSSYHELLDRGIDLIETDLPRRVWPMLYHDVAIPASKKTYLRPPWKSGSVQP